MRKEYMKIIFKRAALLVAFGALMTSASAIQNVYKCYMTSSGSYNCEVVGTRG
jgi:hypothetical protein